MGIHIWTVYEHPSDYPDKYVARLFDGETPTGNIIIADDLDAVRHILAFQMRLTPLMRMEADDPVIVETWL